MQILIVGCGYVGRRCADAWIAEGHHVTALTRSDARAAEFQDAGITPLVGDLVSTPLPDCGPFDVVLYAVGFDRTGGHSRTAVAIDGLRSALAAWGNDARCWIYVSSTSVYGQSNGEVVDEDSSCEPVTEGGICCLSAEGIARDFFQSRRGRSIILRLAGIYGPGRLLSRVAQLREGVPLSGRGDAWLNLVHVDDAVAAIQSAAVAAQFADATFVVCDDRPILREQYYGKLAALAEAPPPRFDSLAGRPRGSGGINKRCSNARLKGELHLQLAFPTIDTGLADAWHRSDAMSQ